VNSNTFNWEGIDQLPYHHNYFIGNDKSKWASNVALYDNIRAKNIYQNIDLKINKENNNLKYDFIIHPGGNFNEIKLNYEGVEKISIDNDGKLELQISFDKIIEQKPYVYQYINGEEIEIPSAYELNNGVISYYIGDHNKNYDLIIDPTVIASTYSGSTKAIYGHTATYDSSGNIYSAGAGFSPGGLPVTTGAYQITYGGARDMCILKFNSTGSALIYATYLGGSKSDYPHSLFDYNNNLYILGTTNSSNFPTSSTAFDQTFNNTTASGHSDIVVTILNSTGSAILGSTYMGGADDDGKNIATTNYGDQYRGEIVVDSIGNAYVSICTKSANFPTTPGAYQTTHGGGQDGVVFKLNSTLSALIYSTYLGGTSADAAFGIKVKGNITYISGTAGSGFFSAIGGAFPSFIGGRDAFVLSLNANASSIISGTYYGTASNDDAFFIEIDANNDVYILGTTKGGLPSSAGKYSRGNGLYVAKFNSTLSNLDFVSSSNFMTPVAFLVDNCGNIYASGHGSVSTLSGSFEITAGFFQGRPAGFYLMVLSPNANGILFGSYYGGANSHVDGGTSRFDKKGVVYQATCSDAGFPTSTGAYSSTSASGGYDVTVFKIDFDFLNSSITFAPSPDDETVLFNKNENCYDIVAFSGGQDTFDIDIYSNAFQYGAYLTLPPQKSNSKYDFKWLNSVTNNIDTTKDVAVLRRDSNTFAGVEKVGIRFCWDPQDCATLEIDTFKIDVIAKGYGCDGISDTAKRTIKIVIDKPKISKHLVPNVFSPNGDKVNDVYRLNTNAFDPCFDIVHIRIYNRWGQLIFESDKPNFEWDGTTKGKKVSAGTYFVVLQGYYGKREVTDQFPVNVFR
jgi:gliding motility-associated-like protein